MKTSMKIIIPSLLLVATLSTAGCAGEKKADLEGVWGPGGEGQPQLILEEDGAFSGTDGCNNIFGTWKETSDGQIEFGDVGSTMMACEGVDAWLSAMSTGTIDGTVMHVEDSSGTQIGTLDRIESK